MKKLIIITTAITALATVAWANFDPSLDHKIQRLSVERSAFVCQQFDPSADHKAQRQLSEN